MIAFSRVAKAGRAASLPRWRCGTTPASLYLHVLFLATRADEADTTDTSTASPRTTTTTGGQHNGPSALDRPPSASRWPCSTPLRAGPACLTTAGRGSRLMPSAPSGDCGQPRRHGLYDGRVSGRVGAPPRAGLDAKVAPSDPGRWHESAPKSARMADIITPAAQIWEPRSRRSCRSRASGTLFAPAVQSLPWLYDQPRRLSYPEMARVIGYADHTTAIHAQ